MSALDFSILCGELLIDPALALEDEQLVQLIRESASVEELRAYMEENF